MNKIALITGGSRGLGRSMALSMARNGIDSIVTYHSNGSAAAEVVEEIQALGRKSVALQLDTGDSASFADFTNKLRESLASHWQRECFNFLINNAGIGRYATISETEEQQFDELMRVHLKGPFFLTQTLLPMIEDGGRIINISSGLARFSLAGYAAYAMMKGGIEVLTRYLAEELGPRRIRVNTVAPGAIETDFGGGTVRDNKDLNNLIASQTPLGRVGLPDDIGGAVAMLLREEAGWINGQRIEVAGGIHL